MQQLMNKQTHHGNEVFVECLVVPSVLEVDNFAFVIELHDYGGLWKYEVSGSNAQPKNLLTHSNVLDKADVLEDISLCLNLKSSTHMSVGDPM
jgi:hypothetical protein